MILYEARFQEEDCNDRCWDMIEELLATHPNVIDFQTRYLNGDWIEFNIALSLQGKEEKHEEIYTSKENP